MSLQDDYRKSFHERVYGSRLQLAEERVHHEEAYRLLMAGKKDRYLPMVREGCHLFWSHSHVGTGTWTVYKDGKGLLMGQMFGAPAGEVFPNELDTFVDGMMACGGLDLDRCWFDEDVEKKP